MKDDSNFWVEETNGPLVLPLKRKRNFRPKRLEYIGWGSKALIEFLHSIGKETNNKLSQYDVEAIIASYVNAHNLFHPEKKKKIICDERLHSLFGKKVVPRIKIYDLLEPHFVENQDSSDDDFGSEEDGFQYSGEKKASNSEHKPSGKKDKVPEIPKSCFAAVVPDNIRLVYLKRTLIQDLVKAPESFEEKLLGSFVRIKCDPHDFRQKLSHQLQQVIGVKMSSVAGISNSEVELQLSDYFKPVPINMLSDDNFSEEECDNLHERVKAGLIKRPTIVELEVKARMLHEDITKHWIPREISRLQKLIDRANEKGWRRELYEYLEKKQLLQKPSEQERLLSEIPKVIAENLEPELVLDALVNMEETSSPKSEMESSLDGNNGIEPGGVIVPSGSSESAHLVHGKESGDFPNTTTCFKDEIGTGFVGAPSVFMESDSVNHREETVSLSDEVAHGSGLVGIRSACAKHINECKNASLAQETTLVIADESSTKTQILDSEDSKISPVMLAQELKPTEVIELSDDEVEVLEVKIQKQTASERPEDKVWFYMDPQGQVQGPFPMTILKRWSDANYFHPEFRVWKKGQTLDEAVLLVDMLHQIFPCI